LAHELRNALATATNSVRAMELSHVPMSGATGAVLKRSLTAMANLISRALDEVKSGGPDHRETFNVASFIADAQSSEELQARPPQIAFDVQPVDPTLEISGNRELLLAALGNLVQNAFKFTRPDSRVRLGVHTYGDFVLVEVEDQCGGLPAGSAERMFTPFTQRSEDRSGLGLGLSIARQSVEADGGTLSVRDRPGAGCVFTISLPRQLAS
jgi:signal transduction histidine kinase